MKTTHVYQHVEYTFSNEGLKVGDLTFPISNGVAKDGVYTHEKFDFRNFMAGFPDEPHIIKDLHHDDKYKPYEVHTSCGYGPVETYFKIIATKDLLTDLSPALQEHYRKKYIKDNGYPMMYVVESNPAGVKKPVARQVTNIKRNIGKVKHGNSTEWIPEHRYYIAGDYYPYEITMEEGKEYCLDEEYGKGFGDLWAYSHYCTLDQQDAKTYYKKELIRVNKKYNLNQTNMLEFVENDKYPAIAGKIRKQLRDYLEKSGLKSLVIGISGGIDSAVVAALAKPVCDEMQVVLIGRSITIKTNSKDEIYRAYAIGNEYCHNFEEIDLGFLYDAAHLIDMNDTIKVLPYITNPEITTVKNEKIREGNIKARLRMMYLYNLASKYKGMVLSTDNYTEYLLGFWTQHGDVGDYSPIQELWKTEVYELAEWLAMESTNINKQLAMKLCIAAMATDGLGVTNKGDLGQILPSWEGSSRDGYKIVDEVLINYLNGEVVEPEHQIILDRNRNSEFKRLTPIFIKRDTII